MPPPPRLEPLPIDPLLPQLRAAVRNAQAVVLRAEPGAGKTTRVPPALLEAGVAAGEVWVVEPRRMAAVLAARRVAHELGEAPGETVGYSVRFDESAGPRTRLRFVTDGLFLRRLVADPELRGIGVVVLDEFHERRLAGDLILGLVRRLQRGPRPDLRLLLMSATLEAETVAAWLGGAPADPAATGASSAPVPVLASEGRHFPVALEHAATLDPRPLEVQVAAAVRQLLQDGLDGDVLVFLPGAAEIRRCGEALAGLAREHDLAVRPLHGALPLDEQERAIAPAGRRKIVLATNIAETSLTLPDVAAVVDSGLARVAGHAAWSGLPTLQLGRISRASATQRAGRAGRTRPGRCLRLYTRFDHDSRPAYDKPEVLRTDLSEAFLELAALGLPPESHRQDAAFWLTPPPAEAAALAVRLLQDLEALDLQGQVTPLGRRVLRYPLHPRLGRLLAAAADRGAVAAGCLVAALLGERDLRAAAGDRDGHATGRRAGHGTSDVLALLDAFRTAEAARFDPRTLRDLGLDAVAARGADRARRQLAGLARHDRHAPSDADLDPARLEEAVGLAVLAGFPDRVARRRAPGSADLELAGGTAVRQGPRSEATEPAFVAVVDAEERRDAKGVQTLVRMASGIEPTWLLDLFPDRVIEARRYELAGARVVVTECLTYLGLVLDETTRPAPPGPDTAAVLVQAVRAQGLAAFCDAEALARLRARLDFARTAGNLGDLPPLDDAEADAVLTDLCRDLTSLHQLRAADLLEHLRGRVAAACGGRGLQQLDACAPESLTLPGGRRVRVQYEPGQAPWVASRLQDFFGLTEGPRLAGGRVPAVLHLLAPNQRPVQVTTDLAGFWQRHYPALRKELGRRYPRHAWPEDPLRAEPPSPRR